jgi:hypothetical protein
MYVETYMFMFTRDICTVKKYTRDSIYKFCEP